MEGAEEHTMIQSLFLGTSPLLEGLVLERSECSWIHVTAYCVGKDRIIALAVSTNQVFQKIKSTLSGLPPPSQRFAS
jgi:hypothetical protein